MPLNPFLGVQTYSNLSSLEDLAAHFSAPASLQGDSEDALRAELRGLRAEARLAFFWVLRETGGGRRPHRLPFAEMK